MSEFSIKDYGIKLGQNNEKCVYESSGFIDIHQKRYGISRRRRQLDEKNTMRPKCLIKKK